MTELHGSLGTRGALKGQLGGTAGGGGGTGNVSSQEVDVIKVLDRAEYDELPQKDPRTLYLIRG